MHEQNASEVPIVYCKVCGQHIFEINPKWIMGATSPRQLKAKIIKEFRRTLVKTTGKGIIVASPLPDWAKDGRCPTPHCFGRWWKEESGQLVIKVPTKMVKLREDYKKEKEAADATDL